MRNPNQAYSKKVQWVSLVLLLGMITFSFSSLDTIGLQDLSPIPSLTHGVASGEVGPHSALLWVRADGPADIRFQIHTESQDGISLIQTLGPFKVTADTDYIHKVKVDNLKSDTLYFYSAWATRNGQQGASGAGFLKTPPLEDELQAVTFVVSGDLGGQGRCRQPDYPIFEEMSKIESHFLVLIGDMIYADESCPSPPNNQGNEFLASKVLTLDAYRLKHSYNRADVSFRKLLSKMPVFATWDDHEFIDDFDNQADQLEMWALGQQSFIDYYPLQPNQENSDAIYRSQRWGQHLELFILDTRQYRSHNISPDNEAKTMLGAQQKAWLKESLANSDATWKVIISSVPISVPKNCPDACDGWANGEGNTGFETEFNDIVSLIEQEKIRNILWITGDVHYPQLLTYDSDGNRLIDFFEFTVGPLSASTGSPREMDPTFNPSRLYADSGYFNFGVVSIDADGRLAMEVCDQQGVSRFVHSVRTLAREKCALKASDNNTDLERGLVGYWPFEEGTGDVAADASENRNEGALINQPEWTIGQVGSALRFNGIDNYVLVPASESLDQLNALTVSLWVFLETDPDATSGNDWRLLFGDSSRGSSPSFGFLMEESRTLTGSLFLNGDRKTLKSEETVAIKEWVHLTFTYDNDTGLIRLYMNGQLVKESTINRSSIDTHQGRPFSISMKQPSGIDDLHTWPGVLDEVRIYNRALTEEEINELFFKR